MNYSNKVRQRFIKDYNLPIQLYSGDYFEYFCNLYDAQYGISEKLVKLDAAISAAGSEEAFLEIYYTLRDNILTAMKETDAYINYNVEDMNQYGLGKISYPSGDIYKGTSIGCYFISIDMKKANFQVMRKYDPTLVFGKDTYEEFLDTCANTSELEVIIDYMKGSKYLRQVIFGNLNPKRQVTMQKYWMNECLKLLLNSELVASMDWPYRLKEAQIVSFSNDEIVFKVDELQNDDELFEYVKFVNNMLKAIEDVIGIQLSVEYFQLHSLFNRYYVKEDLVWNSKVTFKAVPSKFFAQVYKYYYDLSLTDSDLCFKDEGHVAQYLTPLKDLIVEEGALNCEEEET